MLHPPPRQPLPHGAISHRYSVPGFGSLVAVSPDTPQRSSLRPWHGIRGYRPTLPAPSGGGGRRPRSGRAVGVVDEYRSTRDTGDRGGGSPVSPSRGAIPHGYSLLGSGSLFAVSPDTPPKILPQPRARYPGLSSRTCPPPSSGRVVSRIRRFTVVVIWGIKP